MPCFVGLVPDFGGSLLRTVQTFPPLNWAGLREFSQKLVREREVDEGDWRFSPEWWGTQAGGWGHNAGEIVFEAPSGMGNGVVSVTSHPASTPKSSEPHMTWLQVDCLLFQTPFFSMIGRPTLPSSGRLAVPKNI